MALSKFKSKFLMRLDAHLCKNGFFSSRQKAQFAIKAGLVKVNGLVTTKPSYKVQSQDSIEVTGEGLRFVSNGGEKLEKAIRHFNVDFSGKRVLDVGSSTGGFTDCSLKYGAKEVFAVDIGTQQLDASLRKNPKVRCYENTDIRNFSIELLENTPVDIIVADVSFISLTQIIPVLRKLLDSNGFLLALIKPQFEMEKKLRFKKGIVKDHNLREASIQRVINAAENNGFLFKGLIETDIEDCQKKNQEYMALFNLHPKYCN